MSLNMTFTESAADYIKKMCEKDHALGFRLSIKKTGCSGYSYVPSLIKDIHPSDLSIQLNNGIIVYVDSAWKDLLENIQVDYVEEDKLGLKQKKLIFTNPSESGRCGCGESFHVE